jgi:hypothetical protein
VSLPALVGRLRSYVSSDALEVVCRELEAVRDASLADCLARLRAGDLTAGDLEPEDGRDDNHVSLSAAAARTGVALSPASRLLTRTVRGTWFTEALLAEPPVGDVPVTVTDVTVASGDAVPETGIWLAECPNLLLAGQPAPELVRATEAVYWADLDRTDWDTETAPTTWRLLR